MQLPDHLRCSSQAARLVRDVRNWDAVWRLTSLLRQIGIRHVVQVQNPTDDRKRVRPVHVAIAATAKCLSGMMTMLPRRSDRSWR
jgi:hypothetical protein